MYVYLYMFIYVFVYVCMYVAQLRSEQLSYERGGVPLQQSLGAGKSIIRGRVTYIHLDILLMCSRERIHTYMYTYRSSISGHGDGQRRRPA